MSAPPGAEPPTSAPSAATSTVGSALAEAPGQPPGATRWIWLAPVAWAVLGSLVGVITGSASALFLWLLEVATAIRAI